ncbi:MULTISPECIES: hypothetical protein [Ralstonia solanacearum species complex]|uniref:hypothetical protein n=1 Tax=Ralstonia solanacearum species complex TaxID=3116862 RepID=UPI0010718C94|nr:hypothetical protein [Ralstonia pseudosolanacearum]QWQ15072.1 hypothetical protein KN198_22585 [Ralstonia solanacearum]MCK4122328.1 hypothetical protein [Ralstonia pseudosolanacearum]MCK4155050.1 hypothetical protein [Ralstonia pseudosolanacearum]MCQ4678414.1 hypothetical protein [Ralstonia pseudosolanacearum]MDC6283125.1 hypothetical protein [Ralstonia pseudosolanacearum]
MWFDTASSLSANAFKALDRIDRYPIARLSSCSPIQPPTSVFPSGSDGGPGQRVLLIVQLHGDQRPVDVAVDEGQQRLGAGALFFSMS